MSVDIDATTDLLLLIQQKLCMCSTDTVVFPFLVLHMVTGQFAGKATHSWSGHGLD